jgi:hypothetical protein
MRVTIHRRIAVVIALVTLLSLTRASERLAFADEHAAYDEAAPNVNPVEHAALEEHRAQLMKIPGVSLVYVANDRSIVVRVRKLTPDIDQLIPKQLDGCPVKVVSVEDVMRRHQNELLLMVGEYQLYSYRVESLPGGQLAIVIRVRRPVVEQPMKVPTDIEGIPLRVLLAQDPLTD